MNIQEKYQRFFLNLTSAAFTNCKMFSIRGKFNTLNFSFESVFVNHHFTNHAYYMRFTL